VVFENAPINAWIVAVALGVGLIFVAVTRLRGKRVGAFQTKVHGKLEKTTMTYAGVFIPIKYHLIVVDMGVEVRVNRDEYNRIRIGDPVTVARYSNGRYRLE
jgi:hypothetical protein